MCVLVGWKQNTWTNTHSVGSVGGSVRKRDSRHTEEQICVESIQMKDENKHLLAHTVIQLMSEIISMEDV